MSNMLRKMFALICAKWVICLKYSICVERIQKVKQICLKIVLFQKTIIVFLSIIKGNCPYKKHQISGKFIA